MPTFLKTMELVKNKHIMDRTKITGNRKKSRWHRKNVSHCVIMAHLMPIPARWMTRPGRGKDPIGRLVTGNSEIQKKRETNLIFSISMLYPEFATCQALISPGPVRE